MSRGTGHLYQRGTVWWLAISVGGRRIRTSTGIQGGSRGKPPKAAEIYRAEKLLEIGRTGGLVVSPLTVDQACDILENRYKAEERKSLVGVRNRLLPLREAFGGWNVRELTTDRMLAYAARRRDQDGMAVATVNLEMRLLRRAFRLAVGAGRLESFREVPTLPRENVRRGTIDAQPFAAILEWLPVEHRAPARFLRLTGWRAGEALGLMRHRIDRFNQEILLGMSKTDEPRILPYGTYPELVELLFEQEQSAERVQREHAVVVTHVFFHLQGPRVGRPITYPCFYWAWHEARKKAGFPKAIPHDLRRTMVSTLERKGVSRSAGMQITGHLSESAYKRYAVPHREDVQDALRKLTGDQGENVVVKISENKA